MNTRILSSKEEKNLKKYIVPAGVSKSECDLFYYYKKGRDQYLLKKLYNTKYEQMANKLFTVKMLNDYINPNAFPEFVIPKELVSYKGSVIGFSIKEVKDSSNLGIILNSRLVDVEQKVEYLKRIGNLLKRVDKLNEIKFHFNDLHEYNFLVTKDDELKVIDLDSAAMITEYSLPSMYSLLNNNLSRIEKYKSNSMGIYYPSRNIDILSFDNILLKVIGNAELYKLDICEFYDYLAYLKTLGFGTELIDSLATIYLECSNINPVDYLDQIPYDKIARAHIKVFQNLNKVINKIS